MLYSHSFALAGFPEPTPIAGQSFGSLAVAVFFSLSGYLVCQSWSRDPSMWRFAVRRGLRILPGLFVVVIATAFGVGLAYTQLAPSEYLTHPETWTYVPKTMLMLSVPKLPGVFESNPFPNSNNGSLWTLRYEVLMYAVLCGVGSLVSPRKLPLMCATLLATCMVSWVALTLNGLAPMPVPFVWRLGTEFHADRIAYLGAFFFGGSCMYLFRDHLKTSLPAAAVMLGAAVLAPTSFVAMLVLWIAIPYGVMSLAFGGARILGFTRGFDYSYGTYIYAFPIQQALASSIPQLQENWLWSLIAATALTALAGGLSWHFVESPALKAKDRVIQFLRPRSPP